MDIINDLVDLHLFNTSWYYLLYYLLSFSLVTCVMFDFHVQIQRSFRTVHFFTVWIKTLVWFYDFIGTSSQVLLSTTFIPLNAILWDRFRGNWNQTTCLLFAHTHRLFYFKFVLFEKLYCRFFWIASLLCDFSQNFFQNFVSFYTSCIYNIQEFPIVEVHKRISLLIVAMRIKHRN